MAEPAFIVKSGIEIPDSQLAPSESSTRDELFEICSRQAETIERLQAALANLSESVSYLTHRLYGRSREKLPISGQLSLFDEPKPGPEAEEPVLPPDEALASIPEKEIPKKRTRSKRKDLFEGVEVVKKTIRLPEDKRNCEICGSEMSVVGEEMVREEIVIKPIEVKRVQYFKETLVCHKCKDDYGNFAYKSPEAPAPLISHSMASPSAVAYIIYQKFVNHMTFYRLEQELKCLGAPLGRETMASWLITCASILMPMYELLRVEQKLRDILHGDETWCQVLHEKDREATSKSFVWIIVTGNDGLPTIVTYHYAPTRAHTVPEELLGDFRGFFHTDKYDGYNCLESHLTRCMCWAHGRRKWLEVISPQLKNRDRTGVDMKELTPAEIGFLYCDKPFEKERALKNLTPDERKAKRIETEKPLLDSFWAWIETVKPLNGSKLEKAVNYFLDSRTEFENYLLDGRCSISNNLAENNARPYVVGRKTFLFHNSVAGAKASSVIFSIVLTARANNIDIRRYMEFLLQKMPDYKNEPDGIRDLLPWSSSVQSEYRTPGSNKHPQGG